MDGASSWQRHGDAKLEPGAVAAPAAARSESSAADRMQFPQEETPLLASNMHLKLRKTSFKLPAKVPTSPLSHSTTPSQPPPPTLTSSDR